MEEQFSDTYNRLLFAIQYIYDINSTEDFNILDASSITNVLTNLIIDRNKILGIYRQSYWETETKDFYSVPYFHNTDANDEFFPRVKLLKPRRQARETLLQKLHLASSGKWLDAEYKVSEDYTPDKLIFQILTKPQSQSINLPSKHVTAYWTKQCAWEIFLLDTLKYYLPAFGHGNYAYRKLVCSVEDLYKLPKEIRRAIVGHELILLPKVELFTDRGDVRITVHYFNKWKGLVRWTIPYCTIDDIIDENSKCCFNKTILPKETEETIVRYDCGIRY